jgi:hypothetical protein
MYLLSVFLLLPSLVASISVVIDSRGVPHPRLRNYNEHAYANPGESQDFERYVPEAQDEFHNPSISIAVIRNDKTWSKGFGDSDLSSRRI